MLNLTETVKTAERCQRNWDYSNPVTQEDIEKIVGVATSMPTKNNRSYYELIVSTDLDFNKMCYTHAIDKNNPHFNREIHRNTQVLAPLLLIWRPTPISNIKDPFDDNFVTSYLVSIGISTGAAVLTANSLGYRSGYCQCIEQEELNAEMQKRYNISITDGYSGEPDPIIVGFGHPDPNFNRRDCVVNGVIGYKAESIDKTINIKYVSQSG